MRISDWSSDVCSSDLEVRTLSGAGGGISTMFRAALPTLPGVNQLPGVKKTSSDLPDLAFRREGVVVERDHVSAYARVCGFPVKDAIGRASCRERVCQYV